MNEKRSSASIIFFIEFSSRKNVALLMLDVAVQRHSRSHSPAIAAIDSINNTKSINWELDLKQDAQTKLS